MNQVPILMYHWFRREGSLSTSRSPQLEITPQAFEAQLGLLGRRGYRTVALRALVDPAARAGLPERPLVLTFDDGTLDFLEHARPALERHGFRATLFVVAGRVGGESDWDRALGEPPRPLLSWAQLADVQRAGFEIGSHSFSHRPFTTIDDGEVQEEAARSRDLLGERLGAAPDVLAYPRGFYHPRHKAIVRRAGYLGACAVILGFRDLRSADAYALKRMTVKGGESLLRFRMRLALAGRIPLRR
jgi:peptidoglycan/xylan/chitin deacetylase (PgdA/CDA1 family)